MGNLDLNNPIDFARATISPIAALLGELTGRNGDEWDIVECTFVSNQTLRMTPNAKPLRLLVFETPEPFGAGLSTISDTGGRRKVKIQFPYRDGQTTDDLGRKPDTFDVNVLFHGAQYKQALERLLREANQPSPGVLRHPVRGDQPCAFEDYEITHSCAIRKAATVRLRFIEHTFTIDRVDKESPRSVSSIKTALNAALDGIKTVDKLITKVRSSVFAAQQFRNQILAVAAIFKSDYTLNLQKLNRTFNPGTSVDLPALYPVQGANPSNTFPTLLAPNDPFQGVPLAGDTALLTAVASQQAVDDTNKLRDQAESMITSLSEAEDGSGALEFRDDILGLKSASIMMQDVLEAGLQSSRFRILSYTVPRVMSVREVAFAVGLDVQRSFEIELLNPTLLSCNYVAKGTVLKVPH